MLAAASTNILELDELQNVLTKGYLSNAAVTATVSLDGVVVANGSNILCAYVAGSKGLYRGLLPANAALVRGRDHVVTYTITASGFTRVQQHTEHVD